MQESVSRGVILVEEPEISQQGRNLLAVIGIDQYRYWPILQNARHDAEGVKQLFTETLGFECHAQWSLMDQEATADNIRRLLYDQLYTDVQADDNLIIFFAGHGNTRYSSVGTDDPIATGYLIPVDAHENTYSEYVPLDAFLDQASLLPARHILVILDSCRAGIALWGSSGEIPSKSRLDAHVSRQVISSAHAKQDALDGGPIPNHSLFTGMLIYGLEWGEASLSHDDIVTARELGLYLQNGIKDGTGERQVPDFGSFHLHGDGDLVISLTNKNMLKGQALAAIRQYDTPALRKIVDNLQVTEPNEPETRYLDYRLHFMQGDIDTALQVLERLSQTPSLKDGKLPLSTADLDTVQTEVNYWSTALRLGSSDPTIAVDLLTGKNDQHLQKAPVEERSFGKVYQIERGAYAQFGVQNLGDQPAHIYFFKVMPDGRIHNGPLFEGRKSIDGLDAGTGAQGPIWQVLDEPGVIETYIFYSPAMIDKMFFTGVAPRVKKERSHWIEQSDITGVKMLRLWFEVARPEEGKDAE